MNKAIQNAWDSISDSFQNTMTRFLRGAFLWKHRGKWRPVYRWRPFLKFIGKHTGRAVRDVFKGQFGKIAGPIANIGTPIWKSKNALESMLANIRTINTNIGHQLPHIPQQINNLSSNIYGEFSSDLSSFTTHLGTTIPNSLGGSTRRSVTLNFQNFPLLTFLIFLGQASLTV